jgi:hypothetical protein
MTFDNATFQANQEAILSRIKQDGSANDDGWNLIIAGKKESDVVFLQVLKLDMVMALLSATTNMVRFWLHARRSTTTVRGISGCHGFRSYTGWFVQHNGVLNSGRAKSLPVDSMVISELLEYMTPNHVAEWLLAKESYANVFMINPTDGQYHVVRCSSGTLHTDNKGNFSSNAIQGVCDSEVPRDFHTTNTFPVEKEAPVYSHTSYNPHYSRWDWETNDWRKDVPASKPVSVVTPVNKPAALPAAKESKTTWTKPTAEVEDIDWANITDEEYGLVIPDLTFEELRTLFYEKAWDVNGVPKDVFMVTPKRQRGWLHRLEKVSHTTARVLAGGKQ